MASDKPQKLKILENLLRWFAVLILKKYNPRIIGITGSVGKTSAKEAVYTVLAARFRVRKNEKNYNNEIGLPLTIIGAEAGESSLVKWAGVFLKALGVLLFPVEYPEVLVLEMGADRPGDIRYLTSFIKCELAIITEISGSHLEFFKSIDKVAEEKWTLVESLPANGTAIVNVDNVRIAKLRSLKKYEKTNFLTFGFSASADVQAADVFYSYAENEKDNRREIKGIGFKLSHKGTTLPVRFNHILAEHNVYAALAGISAGLVFKLNLVDISAAIENFSMPPGRMNLVAGLRDSVIIDDTYNSSPVSAAAALEVLKNIKARRRIAVMGDMLELGPDTESGHWAVAQKFLEIKKGDIFFAVGIRMKFAASELEKHNLAPERLFVFDDPMSAGKKLKEIIQEGDLVLVKGSQGMRMEKVVEEVMAQPEKAAIYLCRQNKSWREKPWRAV
jgi:UDP-N-acetylmuramoyl-tripeptide--D-alanyl-D-alanine ligase